MLIILLSCIVLFFFFFSLGDVFLTVYNRLCSKSEDYGIFDKLLLGICFIIVPLSLWSLVLPSNHYFLLICLVIILIYWVFNKRKLQSIYSLIRQKYTQLSISHFAIIAFFSILFLASISWEEGIFDSLYYHLQHIRWNEEYPVVPGLGNLTDRFAFNSNYFLISSIFTFRFLLGEAIYPVQSFFIWMFYIWMFYELFVSKYEIKRVILFICSIIFYILSIKFMLATSTDLLPNLIAFYLISKCILYPDYMRKSTLLIMVLPAFIITCKLSMLPFVIMNLYLFIILFSKKDYKTMIFTGSIAFLIVALWLVRNVIVSGYLVYPISEVDLFNVDWKVPRSIAISQKQFIYDIGYFFFEIATRKPLIGYRDPLWMNFFIMGTYIMTSIAIVLSVVSLIRNRSKEYIYTHILFLILILSLFIWFQNGPDSRFIPGILCSVILLGFSSLFIKSEKIKFPRLSISITLVFLLIIASWTSWRIYDRYRMIIRFESEKEKRPFASFLYAPYSYYHFYESLTLENIENHYSKFPLNNGLYIYVSVSAFTYDKLPTSPRYTKGSKLVDYHNIEARGYTLKDGFRHKKEFREIE